MLSYYYFSNAAIASLSICFSVILAITFIPQQRTALTLHFNKVLISFIFRLIGTISVQNLMLHGKTALKWELINRDFLYLSEGSSFFTSFLSLSLSHSFPLHLRPWSVYSEPSQDHEFLALLWDMKWWLLCTISILWHRTRTLA